MKPASNYVLIFEPYVDKYGFPGNRRPDQSLEFGDSAQRLGMMWFFERCTGKVTIGRPMFNVDDPHNSGVFTETFLKGEPKRHWDKRLWEGQPGCMSRDNATPMICAHAGIAKVWHWWLLKRFGFFWNTKDLGKSQARKVPITDFAGPTVWGALWRSAGWWWLWPLLVVTDLFLLLKTLFRIFYSKVKPTHTTDDLNLQVLLHQAEVQYPTPFGCLGMVVSGLYTVILGIGLDFTRPHQYICFTRRTCFCISGSLKRV